MKCPKCGSTAKTNRGFDRKGCRVYNCKMCKSAYMSPEDYTKASANSQRLASPKCPYCGNKSNKNGVTKFGVQRYECKECARSFLDENKRCFKLPKETKRKIITYLHIKDMRKRDIATIAGVDVKTVYNIQNEIKEKQCLNSEMNT